jgi:hypothetical protein
VVSDSLSHRKHIGKACSVQAALQAESVDAKTPFPPPWSVKEMARLPPPQNDLRFESTIAAAESMQAISRPSTM